MLLLFIIGLFSATLTDIVHINSQDDIQQQFSLEADSYLISSTIDLNGDTITIPDGKTLVFRGGSLINGIVAGSFYVTGIKKNSFQVRVRKGGSILNRMPIYNYTPEINASVLSACRSAIDLKEDVIIDREITLLCSVYGNNHTINALPSVGSALVINNCEHGLFINKLRVNRSYSGELNKNYALVSYNSSNITIENSAIEGRIQFVNKMSSVEDEIQRSDNISIRNCLLTCDLTTSPQGWEFGQDHIAFYSINNIIIEDCQIRSTNVNRIIKTSEYFATEDYSYVSRCTDNVVFRNNYVTGRCGYGKQMWDMFCGTTNVVIENNQFELVGFTRVFENKSDQDKYSSGNLVTSTITILNNRVTTSGSDLFQFRGSPLCDNYEIKDNVFVMKGQNINTITGSERSCGGYLQGYNNCIITGNHFIWREEAIGLLSFKVNFNCNYTLIKDNDFVDAYRINFISTVHPVTKIRTNTVGKSFIYTNNKKHYTSAYSQSREELFFADMRFDSLYIDIIDNDFVESYEAIFFRDLLFNIVNYRSKGLNSKSFYNKVECLHVN